MNTAQQIADYRNPRVTPFKLPPERPDPPTPTPQATVPNHLQVIKEVYNAGHYDLSTRMGCGRFLEDATYVLATKADPKWGDLLKRPGQNHWNGHAVDNPLYFSSQAGQSTAVDVVGASESVWAALQWSPDVPRYSPNQWQQRTTGDRCALSPHATTLGLTLMWALSGYRHHRETKLKPAVDRIVTKYRGDWVRVFLTVGGDEFTAPDGTRQDPWKYAGSFFNEPGHADNARDAINWLHDHGLRVGLDLVGSGTQASRQSERFAIADRACWLVETCGPAKFSHLNMWNEYWATGGQIPWLQEMIARVYARLGHAVPLAMDSPQTILITPTSEEEYFKLQAQLQQEMAAMYPDGFNAPNAITPQFNRDLPNPMDMGARAAGLKHISLEPRGVGTSGQSVEEDALPPVHDYAQCVGLDFEAYCGIQLPGIWGGLCNGWPHQNRWPTFDSIPNHEWHEYGLASVRAGVLPDIPTPSSGARPPNVGEPIGPPARTDQLLPNASLAPGEQLVSAGRTCQALYDAHDGNFVIYTATGEAVWDAKTAGHAAGRVQMNPDGNLVIYDAAGAPCWASHTDGHPGAMLQLNDDLNLVIYADPSGAQAGTGLWSSKGGLVIREAV